MKTTLTLKQGSFYFMKNVHLARNTPQEVDLEHLTPVELAGLKMHVRAGVIESSQPIPEEGVSLAERVSQEAPVANILEEVAPTTPSVHERGVSEETTPLASLTVKQLKAKIEEKGATPSSNRKDDLIAQLEAL